MAINIGTGAKKATTIGDYDLGLGTPELDFGENPGGGSGGSNTSGESDTDVLNAFINEMYAQFSPQEVDYETRSEDEIRSEVATWLRPTYDLAISNRQEQTLTNKANLDADAIARGMGASTYVTDVKNRQQNAESSDIASLEAEYGAALAKYVSDEVDSESQQLLEVEEFNAGQRQDAYDLAYDAALQLFAQYKKNGGKSSGSGSSSAVATSRENCEAFLSLLTGEERKAVYEASTAEGAQYRAELLASVGAAGYIQLVDQYPSSP